jgi:diketogulonate reductase-like aldo/keto reductase
MSAGTTHPANQRGTIERHGARIPVVGLGTWDLRGPTCAQVVEQALRIGYRHIDTAQAYDNEREVGQGLRASGVKRSDVFVTTKVWWTNLARRDLESSVTQSLSRLGLDQIDLLLLHWPNPTVPLAESLEALAAMKMRGMARHIGVSNFTVALLEEAVRLCKQPLVTNQIEYHPYLDQSKVIAACRGQGVVVTAYSPIARGRAAGDDVLERIGQAHRKSAAQVSLRWLLQQDVVAIPRTSRSHRLRENITIFDFALSPAEMLLISSLARPDGRQVKVAWAPTWD